MAKSQPQAVRFNGLRIGSEQVPKGATLADLESAAIQSFRRTSWQVQDQDLSDRAKYDANGRKSLPKA